MALNPFGPGTPTLKEEYRGSYMPKTIETWYGLQVVAPDTPYVAAAGQKNLYFIDTRFDEKTAKHIKENIEQASCPEDSEGRIVLDEILVTAKKKSSTGQTIFVFDPLFVSKFWAKEINKRNPEINLPERGGHGLGNEWMRSYDLDILTKDTTYPPQL